MLAHDTSCGDASLFLPSKCIVVIVTVYSRTGNVGGFQSKVSGCNTEGSQRLIISQAEGSEFYYELPYLILPREYRRIPYNCREAIPRHFEKGWEEKLAMKYQVLCMAKKLPLNQETDNLLPSKTDLKIGCRRMENLARIYWKEKGYNIQ